MRRRDIKKIVERADIVLGMIESACDGIPTEGYEIFDYWEIISDMRAILFEILKMTNESNTDGNTKEDSQ